MNRTNENDNEIQGQKVFATCIFKGLEIHVSDLSMSGTHLRFQMIIIVMRK